MTTIKEEIEKYNKIENEPVLIFGTSGISKEVYSVIAEINEYYKRQVFDFRGYVAESSDDIGTAMTGGVIACSDDTFEEYISGYDTINVVVPLGTPAIKKKIVNGLSKYDNLRFPNIISPTSKVMLPDTVTIGEGSIICSGVVITVDVNIGSFVLLNLNTTVGHDVELGNYCVVNPLTAISGFTDVADDVLIGAGVSIKEHTRIEQGSIVGMGAIACKNVEERTVVISDAAHVLKKL